MYQYDIGYLVLPSQYCSNKTNKIIYYGKTTKCQSCYTNKISNKLPRIFIIGRGYICFDCFKKLIERSNNLLEDCLKELDKPEYINEINKLIADKL